MSGEEPVIDHGRHDCGADVAAYALGALDPGELDRFQGHLTTCVVCRDELASFQQIVNVLPMSAPQYRAPDGLRRRVMHAVDADVGATPPVRFAPAPRSRRRLTGWRLPRPALGFGAAALAVAVAAVVVVLSVGGGSSPSSRVIDAKVTGHGSARLRLSGGRAELVVNRFASPPAGQIYEVWLQKGKGAPAPNTLFGVFPNGSADVGVAGDLRGVTHVLVTREPAGGTTKPTHPPVIDATLT